MIICKTHNHNYPHQVDGEEACSKCESEAAQKQAIAQTIKEKVQEESQPIVEPVKTKKKSDKI